MLTRTDCERNNFFVAVLSLVQVGVLLENVVRVVITSGLHISVSGLDVLAFESGLLNERHLEISKSDSFRCPAMPAAAKGKGTNR